MNNIIQQSRPLQTLSSLEVYRHLCLIRLVERPHLLSPLTLGLADHPLHFFGGVVEGEGRPLEGDGDPVDQAVRVVFLNLEEVVEGSHQVLPQQVGRVFDDFEVGSDAKVHSELPPLSPSAAVRANIRQRVHYSQVLFFLLFEAGVEGGRSHLDAREAKRLHLLDVVSLGVKATAECVALQLRVPLEHVELEECLEERLGVLGTLRRREGTWAWRNWKRAARWGQAREILCCVRQQQPPASPDMTVSFNILASIINIYDCGEVSGLSALEFLHTGQQLVADGGVVGEQVAADLEVVLEFLPSLLAALGPGPLVLDGDDGCDYLDEDLLEGLHGLDGVGLLELAALLPELFLEELGLVLVLLDEVLDLVLVEVLQLHQAVLLLLGLHELLLHALDLVVEQVVLLDGQPRLVLQLPHAHPRRVPPLHLHAQVVAELLLPAAPLALAPTRTHLVDVLPDELRVAQRVDLPLQQPDPLPLLVDGLLQRFYVGGRLLKESPLLHASQLHLLVGELVAAEHLRHVGDDALVLVEEGLARLGQLQLHSAVAVGVAEHGVAQTALALQRLPHLRPVVLRLRDVTAEVHLLQLHDVLQLLDASFLGGHCPDEAFHLLLLHRQLPEQLLLHCRQSAVQFPQFRRLRLQLCHPLAHPTPPTAQQQFVPVPALPCLLLQAGLAQFKHADASAKAVCLLLHPFALPGLLPEFCLELVDVGAVFIDDLVLHLLLHLEHLLGLLEAFEEAFVVGGERVVGGAVVGEGLLGEVARVAQFLGVAAGVQVLLVAPHLLLELQPLGLDLVDLVRVHPPFHLQLLLAVVQLLRYQRRLRLPFLVLAPQLLVAVLAVGQLLAEVAQFAGQLQRPAVLLEGLLTLQFKHTLTFLQPSPGLLQFFPKPFFLALRRVLLGLREHLASLWAVLLELLRLEGDAHAFVLDLQGLCLLPGRPECLFQFLGVRLQLFVGLLEEEELLAVAGEFLVEAVLVGLQVVEVLLVDAFEVHALLEQVALAPDAALDDLLQLAHLLLPQRQQRLQLLHLVRQRQVLALALDLLALLPSRLLLRSPHLPLPRLHLRLQLLHQPCKAVIRF